MRVFLVDDEFLQRALVKKTVDWNSLGMEICGEAEDGEEALKKILEEKPDILIMDINIPYMNGIEVSKKVKVIFPEIQVIILTAYGEFEYAREALSFGAVSFVLKPLDPEELTKELQKCKEKLEHIYRQKSSVKKMQKDQFLLEQLSGMVPSENQQSKWEEMKIPFDKPLSVRENIRIFWEQTNWIRLSILTSHLLAVLHVPILRLIPGYLTRSEIFLQQQQMPRQKDIRKDDSVLM